MAIDSQAMLEKKQDAAKQADREKWRGEEGYEIFLKEMHRLKR